MDLLDLPASVDQRVNQEKGDPGEIQGRGASREILVLEVHQASPV